MMSYTFNGNQLTKWNANRNDDKLKITTKNQMKTYWFNWWISACFRTFSKPLLKSPLDCHFVLDTRMNHSLSSIHGDEFKLCTYLTVIFLLITCPIASIPVYQHFCLFKCFKCGRYRQCKWWWKKYEWLVFHMNVFFFSFKKSANELLGGSR